MHRFCRNQLGSHEEAEDATQLTFIQALRGLERGASLDSEPGWLFTIPRNVCLNSKRSRFRRSRLETPSSLYEDEEASTSLERKPFALLGLVDALQALPSLQRQALLLREWQGLSYAEITTDLELSQAAVETLLYRARRTVAAALSDGSKRRASFTKRSAKH
jgi:RNA polymerase sigma-70 factor (ECF subfamily)